MNQIDQDRRRRIIQQVWRKVEGWQHLYMTNIDGGRPSIFKGRYQAAKEFYDWLSDGGDLVNANEFLAQNIAKWKLEEDTVERLKFSAELASRIAKGWDTKESLVKFAHLFTGDDELTEFEKQRIDFLKWQFKASQIELEHLRRLL
jgi:hypothetical protein